MDQTRINQQQKDQQQQDKQKEQNPESSAGIRTFTPPRSGNISIPPQQPNLIQRMQALPENERPKMLQPNLIQRMQALPEDQRPEKLKPNLIQRIQRKKEEEQKLQMKKEQTPAQLKKDEEEKKPRQMKSEADGDSNALAPVQLKSDGGTGSKMPEDVKAKMETSFGTDFSSVNIHTNSDKAPALNAQAYTQGNDIHFAPGKFNPGSQKGQELLGHELTHVVQQRQGKVQTTTQLKGAEINDSPGLEKEADDFGKMAARGTKVPKVSEATNSIIQKTSIDDSNLGTDVEDSSIYYVHSSSAIIRTGSNFTPGNTKIPTGTKVKRTRKGTTANSQAVAVAYVEILDTCGNTGVSTGTKYWTAFGNITASNTEDDTESYFVQYSDTMVYTSPYGLRKTIQSIGETINQKLEPSRSTGYTVFEKCGKFVNIKQGSTEIGWVYKDDLADDSENDRAKFMNEYQEWLEARYSEVIALTGQNKLDRIRGILSQSEIVFTQIENDNYPSVNDLDKEPEYVDNATQSVTPHELVYTIRKFIVLTERIIEGVEVSSSDSSASSSNTENNVSTPANLEAIASENQFQGEVNSTTGDSPNNIPDIDNSGNTSTTVPNTTSDDNDGSLYSDIDWNTRLKVNQYRTQSDNLTSPETTCAPTTFAMMVERMGYNRKDVIEAITQKLGTFSEYTSTDEAWKKKSEAFFNWHNTGGSSNYQKTRGGNEGLLTKSKELGEKFREFGQLEDLLHFYHYLLNNDDRTTILSEAYNNKLRSAIENNNDTTKGSNFDYVQLWPTSFDSEFRKKLKNYLDEGSIISLSVFHKGKNSTGTHVVYVRSIESDGIILDDPYGGINSEYRRTSSQKSDFYLPMGDDAPANRGNYNYKNKPDYNTSENDYSKRDFSYNSGHNLESNESRGESTKITWDMLRESDYKIINYVMIFKRKKNE